MSPAYVNSRPETPEEALARQRIAKSFDNTARDPKRNLPSGEAVLGLLERDMPPVTYLCDPWIAEGLHLIASRPKLGKSTLLRQELASVAGGDSLFGSSCQQATAVFLSLEEGDRLTRRKFELASYPEAAMASIIVHFQWPRGQDGVDDIRRLLDSNESIKYVGIDSLTRFRSVPDSRLPGFIADYEAVSALHSITKERPGLAIRLIHHSRKAKSDDPIDDISGTYGVSAAVDSYWVLRHHEDGAVLHVGGRLWDRDQSQYQLRKANQRWELVGEFSGLSPEQQKTVDLVRSSGGIGVTDAGSHWGVSRQLAYDRLEALVDRGAIRKANGTYYAL